MSETPETRLLPPYRWAVLTAVFVFIVYILTLAPTTAFWDTSEYIAAAKTLGIPHPPGNPLFVVLAHVFGLLPLAASYSVRINLFAAVTSALAAGFWFLVAERWLRNLVEDRTLRLGAAAAGVLVGAFSWTVWNQSTVNEKVYTVSLFWMALATWLAVHWGDDKAGAHRDRWLVLIAYVIALNSTNHMMGVLAAPALAVYVLWTDWRIITRPWAMTMGWFLFMAVSGVWQEPLAWLFGPAGSVPGGLSTGSILIVVITLGFLGWAALKDVKNPLLYLGIFAVLVGVSLNYVFLPIRAGQFPAINEGEPVGFFSQALMDVLNRVQYQKPSVFVKPWYPYTQPRDAGLFLSQLGNYWQYFSWQFARDWPEALRGFFTALFAVTGLSGLWSLIKRDKRAGVAAAAMLFTLTIALVFYLNFKYGFSMHPGRTDIDANTMREVRERDYFFMGSFAFFGTLVAAGLGAAAVEAVRQFRSRLAALPVLGLALVPLFGNRLTASRAHESIAFDFAVDLLQSVEPYGILITAGDNDTFPLWFAQEVEGVRTDVTLVNLSLANTEWHLRQIQRRQTPEFDPAKSIDLWKPRSDTSAVRLDVPPGGWQRPTTSPFALSLKELDSLPEISTVKKGQIFKVGDIDIKFGTEYVEKKDLAVIFLIRDNLDKRPIYFAWSDANYPDETLGLTQYLVSQGLVRKLRTSPVVEGGPIEFTTLGFTDIPRTKALLQSYHWQSVTRDRPRGWVDPPSASILRLYSIVYGLAAETMRQHGDSAFAARADSIARKVEQEIRPR